MSTTHCALLPSPIGFLGTLAKCDLPLLMNYKLQNMNVFTSQHTWDTNSHLLLSQQDQKHSPCEAIVYIGTEATDCHCHAQHP